MTPESAARLADAADLLRRAAADLPARDLRKQATLGLDELIDALVDPCVPAEHWDEAGCEPCRCYRLCGNRAAGRPVQGGLSA